MQKQTSSKTIDQLEEVLSFSDSDYTLIETAEGTKKIMIQKLKDAGVDFNELEETTEVEEDAYTLIKTKNGNKKIKTEKIKNENCFDFSKYQETALNLNNYVLVMDANSTKKIKLSNVVDGLAFDINKQYSQLKTTNKTIIGAINELLTLLQDTPIDPEQPGDTILVESIKLSDSELTLKKGEEYQLTATITPSNATNQKITWSCDDSIVTVSDEGLIVGVYDGFCTISAECGGKIVYCNVEVTRI